MATLCGLGTAVTAQSETLRVGTSADYAPFKWVDGNSNLVGLDMDVMRAVAIINNYEVDIQDVGFDTLIASLQEDRLDIAAGIQINEQRRQVIDASTPYVEVLYGVALRKDVQVTSSRHSRRGRRSPPSAARRRRAGSTRT